MWPARRNFPRYTGSRIQSRRKPNNDVTSGQRVRSAYYHLSRIAKMWDSISTTVCKSLIHGLVTSRLDYGNAILYGISDRHMHRLEMVQRSAARIVRQIRRGDRQSMTTILRQLHWLPVRKRIDFKLLVLVHRAIYNGTPEYLAALLRRHTPPRSLRFAGGLLPPCICLCRTHSVDQTSKEHTWQQQHYTVQEAIKYTFIFHITSFTQRTLYFS